MVSFLLHLSLACVSHVGAWGLSSGEGSHCSGLGALGAPRNYKHSRLVWLVTDSEARECLTAQPDLEDVRSNHPVSLLLRDCGTLKRESLVGGH